MEKVKCKQVANIIGGGYNEMTARVYDPNGASPTVRTCAGGNLEPKIAEPHTAAMRGRNPDNPSDRTAGLPTEQRLEIGGEVANALTTVQKDSLVVYQMEQVMFTNPIKEIFLLTKEIDENERISYETSRPLSQGQGEIRVGQQIRVRKLTEREAGRLMGVKDEDIDRIAQHQSKSSQYHLYGDSIVVPVLMTIFAPMFGKMLTEEHINEIYKE